MKAFTSSQLPDLVQQLRRDAPSSGRFVIGVDGIDGAGKTRLSLCLACELGCDAVDLDHFLPAGDGCFLDRLQYDQLSTVFSRQRGTVVVSGICLLAALSQANVAVDRLVYVMRWAQEDYWLDEEEGEHRDGAAEQLRARAPHLPGLKREIAEYHLTFRPLNRAAYVFKRLDLR